MDIRSDVTCYKKVRACRENGNPQSSKRVQYSIYQKVETKKKGKMVRNELIFESSVILNRARSWPEIPPGDKEYPCEICNFYVSKEFRNLVAM